MSRNALWPQQARVHKFMLDYQRQHGMPPSTCEIARFLGLKGTTGAYQHVLALLRKGAVVAHPRGLVTQYLAVPLPSPKEQAHASTA